MNKLTCPHCGKPGISVLRKMFLGPAVRTACKTCGEKVGVPWISMLGSIPAFVAVAAISLAESYEVKGVILLVTVVLLAIANLLWVPLERR